MISTRFLPMSWTSPFTVASTSVARVAASRFSMNGSRWATAAFLASAHWSTPAPVCGPPRGPAPPRGEGRVAREPLGVDDRVVEARLGRVVEEDRVQHLPASGRQSERYVGDAEDRLALGEARLDGAPGLAGLVGGGRAGGRARRAR